MSDGEWVTFGGFRAWVSVEQPTGLPAGTVWIRKTDPSWEAAVTDLTCPWFWGSHGCDLPAGHDGAHVCQPKCPRCEAAQDGYDDDCDLGCCGWTWEPGADGEFR